MNNMIDRLHTERLVALKQRAIECEVELETYKTALSGCLKRMEELEEEIRTLKLEIQP